MVQLHVVVFLTVSVSCVYGAVCQNPRVTTTATSTRDAFFHSNAAFVVEMTVKCSNDAKDLALYGEVNGRIIPAGHVPDSDRYQISWTEEHDKTKAGKYQVNIVDEDGYSLIRKAIRNNEDYSSKIKPLAVATIEHGGPAKGPYVSSETIALVVAVVICYFAVSWRSSLQS